MKTTLFLLSLCLSLIMIAGCGAAAECTKPENASSAKCTAINTLLQCGDVVKPDVEASAAKELDALLAKARGADGGMNMSAVRPQLEDLAIKYGGCVIATVFSRFTSGKLLAGENGTTGLAPESAKQEFNLLRAKLWPGRGFQTEGGQL